MADLGNTRNKLNDTEISANKPLTEALFLKLGGPINDYIDFVTNFEANAALKSAAFSSSDTWDVPSDVTKVLAIGWGGGGAGGAGGTGVAQSGDGGSGAPWGVGVETVTPSGSVTVTIGAGGTGGAGTGPNGGPSAFGSVNFRGGRGGLFWSGTSYTQPPFGGAAEGGTISQAGADSFASTGGTSAGNWGGGGGAGPGGAGANGVVTGQPPAAGANTGGGGAGATTGIGPFNGGDGGSGKITILYWSYQA